MCAMLQRSAANSTLLKLRGVLAGARTPLAEIRPSACDPLLEANVTCTFSSNVCTRPTWRRVNRFAVEFAGAAANGSNSSSRQYATDLQTDVAHIGTSLANVGMRAGPGGRSSVRHLLYCSMHALPDERHAQSNAGRF